MRVKAIGFTLLVLAATILSVTTVSAREVQILRGDVWQGMNVDEKVAFIWGAGQVVLVENEIMAEIPELKVDNFSAKVAEGVSDDMSVNALIASIDSYYETHPDKKSMPVIHVIWDTTIKPNLTTGIGGRPLK